MFSLTKRIVLAGMISGLLCWSVVPNGFLLFPIGCITAVMIFRGLDYAECCYSSGFRPILLVFISVAVVLSDILSGVNVLNKGHYLYMISILLMLPLIHNLRLKSIYAIFDVSSSLVGVGLLSSMILVYFDGLNFSNRIPLPINCIEGMYTCQVLSHTISGPNYLSLVASSYVLIRKINKKYFFNFLVALITFTRLPAILMVSGAIGEIKNKYLFSSVVVLVASILYVFSEEIIASLIYNRVGSYFFWIENHNVIQDFESLFITAEPLDSSVLRSIIVITRATEIDIAIISIIFVSLLLCVLPKKSVFFFYVIFELLLEDSFRNFSFVMFFLAIIAYEHENS